jgi:prophage antirepressor-like protein
MQTYRIINESGLYSLIMSSKLPKAKEFKRWVTSEVLPTIRKTGEYKNKKSLANPEIAKTRAAAMILNAKNRAATQMMKLWSAAGVEPQYQALALNGYYDGLQVPRIALKETATVLLDITTIAKHRKKNLAEHTDKPLYCIKM